MNNFDRLRAICESDTLKPIRPSRPHPGSKPIKKAVEDAAPAAAKPSTPAPPSSTATPPAKKPSLLSKIGGHLASLTKHAATLGKHIDTAKEIHGHASGALQHAKELGGHLKTIGQHVKGWFKENHYVESDGPLELQLLRYIEEGGQFPAKVIERDNLS